MVIYVCLLIVGEKKLCQGNQRKVRVFQLLKNNQLKTFALPLTMHFCHVGFHQVTLNWSNYWLTLLLYCGLLDGVRRRETVWDGVQ